MISADEARDRGLGCPRGLMILAPWMLALIALVVWLILR